MGKIKAKKVMTPGSKSVPVRKKGGRPPSKKKAKVGTDRKNNYRSKYSQEDLLKAIEDVKDKKLSIRAASILYGIPRTTIGDHIEGRAGPKVGRPTELSEDEEAIIVKRLLYMAKWGYPLGSKDTRYQI